MPPADAVVETGSPWLRKWSSLLGVGHRTGRSGPQGPILALTVDEVAELEQFLAERQKGRDADRKVRRAIHRGAMAESLGRRRAARRRKRARYAAHGSLLRERFRDLREAERALADQRRILAAIEAARQQRAVELQLVEEARRRRFLAMVAPSYDPPRPRPKVGYSPFGSRR